MHAALLFVQVTFGAFHVVAKAVLSHLHPLAVAGIRVAVAAPLLLALAWAIDRTLPRLRDLPHLALLGLLGVFANQLLFIVGLRYTTAINASILMPSIPVFAAAVAIAARLEHPDRRRLAGISLAVAGALVMLEPLRFRLDDSTLIGNLMVLANCASYATFLVLMRPLRARLPATTVIAWSFLFGGSGVLFVTLPWVRAVDPASLPSGVWLGLVYIVLIPTALNYWLNSWALGRATSSLVATYTTLQPLSASLLAILFLGERIGWPQLLGGLLIIAGLQRVARASAQGR